MFHSGDLQSGITLAIQETKLVVCFVRNSTDDECRVWEEEWLGASADSAQSLGNTIASKAVLLRIDSGTPQEAFLQAVCPVSKVPTLVVIHNGQVLEKLESGIGEEEFRSRLLKACGLEDVGESASTVPSVQPGDAIPLSTPDPTPAPAPPTQSPSTAQTLLTERGQRLEAERQKREAAEKAERTARANARRKEAEQAATAASNKQSSTLSQEERDKQQSRDAWLVQQKQRKDEAKKERERILNQIESDKQERRAQKERQREAQQAGGGGQFSALPPSAARSSTINLSGIKSCALQVRLFDGSSIRGKFASDAVLAGAVRDWVKEASPEGGADIPYTFRHILPPQPSRSIGISEEHQSLLELGLAPTATLVLVPVAGYTSAYERSGTGYLSAGWDAAAWATKAATSAVGTAASYIPVVNWLYPGGSGETRQSGDQASVNDQSQRPEGAKVNTLFNQRREQDKDNKPTTFYNGNSSAFQGNGPPDGGDGTTPG